MRTHDDLPAFTRIHRTTPKRPKPNAKPRNKRPWAVGHSRGHCRPALLLAAM